MWNSLADKRGHSGTMVVDVVRALGPHLKPPTIIRSLCLFHAFPKRKTPGLCEGKPVTHRGFPALRPLHTGLSPSDRRVIRSPFADWLKSHYNTRALGFCQLLLSCLSSPWQGLCPSCLTQNSHPLLPWLERKGIPKPHPMVPS